MKSPKVPVLLHSNGVWAWLMAGLLTGLVQVQAQDTANSPAAGNSSVETTIAAPTALPASAPSPTASNADGAAPGISSVAAPATVRKAPTPVDARPHWNELSRAQQHALQPLAAIWPALSGLHKRKWLVLSQNFAELSPQEQRKLQDRMSEWANLTARERAQARLHFAEVRQLPDDERRAKWEAYQALSDEQRRKLADDILLEPPRGAAVATRLVAPSKLTQSPAPKPDQVLQPRIDTDQINPKTLLPHFLQGTSTR